MSMAGVVAYIQATVGAVEGIRLAPAYPPEQANVYPFAVCYPGSGSWTRMSGWKKAMHTVNLEIHWPRKDLYRDVERAVEYAETIPNDLLSDPTLGGNCETITDMSYSFGAMTYGGVDTIGWRYSITYKDETAIT